MQYFRNLNEEILLNRTLERRNEELLKLLEAWQTKSQKKKPRLIRSMNMHEVENMMIRYYQVYKVPVSLYDEEGKLLFSIGWKNICMKYHNLNHHNLRNCTESMVQINNRMADVNSYIFRCMNRINSIAIPITVEGDNLGTLIVNQFLYEDELLDPAAIQKFAYENGLDFEEYKKALSNLPVLSRGEVEKMTEYYILFSEMLAFIASHNIEQQEHQNLTKEKNEIYNIFKEKLDEQSFIIKSVYQFMLQQNQELDSLRNEVSLLRKKGKHGYEEKSLVEESQPG